MSNNDHQLLSFGVFLIIIVVGILLAIGGIIGWGLFVPVVALLCGLWAIALGGMRASKTQKYERGSFSTMASGAGLIALFGINWLYSLVVILLAIAALAIATSLKRK
jgi:hypothetical protein